MILFLEGKRIKIGQAMEIILRRKTHFYFRLIDLQNIWLKKVTVLRYIVILHKDLLLAEDMICIFQVPELDLNQILEAVMIPLII